MKDLMMTQKWGELKHRDLHITFWFSGNQQLTQIFENILCYFQSRQKSGWLHTLTMTDNPNTTQALEYTKDKYNVKIIKRRVSPKVPPTTYKD
jgi:hypothetical protein